MASKTKYFLILGVIVVVIGWIFYTNSISLWPGNDSSIVDSAPPERGIVKRIIDPITIELESGHRVRYIGVRTPSVATTVQCFGKEALLANESVLGQEVRLEEEPLLARSQDGAWTRYVWLIQGQVDPSPTPSPAEASPEAANDEIIEAGSADGPTPGDDGLATDVAETDSPGVGLGDVVTQAQEALSAIDQLVATEGQPVVEQESQDLEEADDPRDILINERILEGGFGFPVVASEMEYGERMLAAARFASATGKGLWSQCEVANEETPSGVVFTTNEVTDCTIRGKVTTTGEKLYRTESCAAYGETIVIQADGGAWFCAEDTAVDAGFNKATDCP